MEAGINLRERKLVNLIKNVKKTSVVDTDPDPGGQK
jgi:hypothetical protein